MTWLFVAIWVLGAALFVFSFWVFGLAAMRTISGRRRTRRIWHGQVSAPRTGPLRPGGFMPIAAEPSRRHRHRARREQRANGGKTWQRQ